MSIISELREIIEAGYQVRLARPGMEAEFIHGYPLCVRGNLLLLQDVEEFRPDGYSMVRVCDIEDLRSGNYERFSERVLRDEGWTPRVPADIEVGDFQHLFETFHRSGEIVIVECESNEDEDFYIGRVTGVTEDHVDIHYFNALAELDPHPTRVDLHHITRAQFRNRYIGVYDRYVERV